MHHATRDGGRRGLVAEAPVTVFEERGDIHESGGQVQPTTANPEDAKATELIQEIVDNLAFVKGYEDLQRRAEEEEAEFELDMWGQDARRLRAEHEDEVTGQTVPAKPTLSVPLNDIQVQQVVNDARQARLALTVKPRNGLALKKIGQYLKGLVRTIQVESGALEIRLWALERTVKHGRGGWCLVAEFANDGDFDIDLREKRILDYGTVYWDPYRQRADNSDADWCFVTDWISEKERLRRWPDKPIIPPQNAWDADHDWFAADGDNPANRRVRIGLYYKVLHEEYLLGYHPQGGVGWVDRAPEKTKIPALSAVHAGEVKANAPGTQQRKVDVPRVHIYTVDGSQILEEHPWHGRYIPVIEIVGKEFYLKGKRRWKGIIANTMDLLRAVNVLVSAATELAGTMVRIPYLMAAGQDEGFEDMWDMASVRNYTRLYYNVVDVDGKSVGPPQRQPIELQVNGLLMLLRMMHEMYHAVSGTVAPQMRAVNPYDRSGKAIEALQRQGAAGTSNYLDNMATISMLYEGKVMLDAIPHYYDKEGRILYVEGDEQEDEVGIMIKRPFIRDTEGIPVADARQARLALTVKPRDGLALKKIGQYLKGLVRTIQVESGALEIRLWALERTVKHGRGGWCLVAEFANDGDFDIDLREKRILDYGTVYWDPYRQRADNADAEWCLVTDWISEKERLRRWPTKPLVAPQNAWDADHDWFAADGDNPANRRVRIGLYYKILHDEYLLGYHPQGGVGWVDRAPEKTLFTDQVLTIPPE
jgi:hypothetical protein